MMNHIFHGPAVSRQMLSWMLVMALLLFAVIPVHYHLDHADPFPAVGSALHGHVADLHIPDGARGDDHHDGHAFEPMPDATHKNVGVLLPLVAVFLVAALLMPASMRVIYLSRLTLTPRLPRFYRHTTPPLRAPPRG